TPQAWTRQKTPRRAGVNGFGFGGTNSHLILEEFDPGYHAAWQGKIRSDKATNRDEIVGVRIGVVRPDQDAACSDARNLRLPPRQRVLPDVLDSMDRSQILAVMVADQALASVGSRWTEWRKEIGVVLGFEGKVANALSCAQRLYVDRIKRRLSLEKLEGEEQQAVERLTAADGGRERASGHGTHSG